MLDLETIARDRAARKAYWRERGVYTDFNYGDAFREGGERFGGTRVIFHSRVRPKESTVAEMNAAAERIASAFHKIGLAKGDRIAIMLPTWWETTVAYLAALKLGVAVVPIVAIYGAREIGFIMRQTRAKALIVPDVWRGFDYIGRVKDAGEMPGLKQLIVVGQNAPRDAMNWEDLLAHRSSDYPIPQNHADDGCIIIYTSGTTADPKGVVHTHNTMLCDMNAARAEGVTTNGTGGLAVPAGISLCVFPAGHIAGFLAQIRPFVAGGDVVYVDQWIAEDGAQLIEKYRITSSIGTPIFLSTLMKAAENSGADISSLKQFSLGASAVTPENIRQTDARGFPSGRVYGMTEHTVVSAPLPGDSFERRAHTDGHVTPRNEVRIIDDNEMDVSVGEVGEIVTRGPRLFMGYVDENLDRSSFLPGGWYKTGDIGKLDAEGYLTVTDRKKDIIIRGGENISSKEVEDVLSSLPNVVESAVTAMPDPVLGERVCAFIVPVSGKTLTFDDVSAHFRKLGITRQKMPERIVILDDLPRTPSGKVKKAELRAKLKAGEI